MFDRRNYILSPSSIEKDLLRLFKKNDKLIIFDIGGCEGEESIRYSRIFQKSLIYIFEPLPDNQKLIVSNFVEYNINNIQLVSKAVSDSDAFADFYVSSGHPENQKKDLDWNFGNKSNSLLNPVKINNPSWLNFNDKIKVETISLNTFLNENNISEVDFIHMDVQGAELKVLIGAKKYISSIKAIWLEVSNVELYKNQALRKDIELFMNTNGFYLIKSEFEGNVGDQLYLNKKYFKTFLINSKFQFHIKK